MRILVLSCSLAQTSSSRTLANAAAADLRGRGVDADFIDLRDHPLPLCDGGAPDAPHLAALADAIREADAVIVGVPIYNYDVNAAAKNMVELTGRGAWTDKVVGFICAAGGKGSYMSVMGLANSLMLDFRCVVVPRFVYATGAAFDEEMEVTDPGITRRLGELCGEIVRFAEALR